MKHKHNRLGLLSLTLVLCFSLSACQWVMSFLPSGSTSAASPAETQQQFDDFLQQQFVKNITADTLSMHQLLKCPANFGITDYAATWGDYTCAYPTDEQIAQDRQDMQILQSFDRSQLTPAQQASYDILQYEAQLYDQSLQFFYYDDPFGNNNEFHAMIPVMLSEYDFFSKQDVENYLTLCGSMDQLWNGCLQFEQQKSAKGLFMTDTQVTTIVNDCQTFLSKTDDNVLITSFKTRIDAIPFLTDAEKTDYITRNQDIFNNTVVPAYHTLMDGLTALKGTGQNSGGLALFDQGQEYYAFKLKQMGLSSTPEDLIALCESKWTSDLNELSALYGAHANEWTAALSNPVAPSMSAPDLVNFWTTKAAADFPALPAGVTYEVKPLDASVKNAISSPAFYMVPRLDNYQNNTIYFNDTYQSDQDYFAFMLAHEGCPGHMLQLTTLMAGDLSDFRKADYYTAYAEGWAQYAQYYCYTYTGAPGWAARALQLSDELSYVAAFRLDLGVNYQGWTQEQMTAYIQQNYAGMITPNSSMYDSTVQMPLEYAPYYAGKWEIEFHRDSYQNALGSQYSDLKFHTAYLNCGDAPFSLVWQWMDQQLGVNTGTGTTAAPTTARITGNGTMQQLAA